MLNYKHSLHYSIFSFIYMLFASVAIQASKPLYQGDFIVKSELSTKVSTGIDNYKALLENHKKIKENKVEIGHVLFLFDGKEILQKKPKTNAKVDEVSPDMVSWYQTKNIEALIKEKKGNSFNIETQSVSKKEFTKILHKVLNIDQLEKETGLQASLKLLNMSSLKNNLPSKSYINVPAIQSDKIFKFFSDTMSLTDDIINNSTQLMITRGGYTNNELKLRTEIMILIDLKDPSKDNDKNSNTNNNSNGNQELVKRILIGTAIVSPFLLLMGVFFYKKKKAAKKKNQLTQSPSSNYNTSVSSTTKERTTETTQKRPNQKRKAR